MPAVPQLLSLCLLAEILGGALASQLLMVRACGAIEAFGKQCRVLTSLDLHAGLLEDAAASDAGYLVSAQHISSKQTNNPPTHQPTPNPPPSKKKKGMRRLT